MSGITEQKDSSFFKLICQQGMEAINFCPNKTAISLVKLTVKSTNMGGHQSANIIFIFNIPMVISIIKHKLPAYMAWFAGNK